MTNDRPSSGSPSVLAAFVAGVLAVVAVFWVPVAFQIKWPPSDEPALPYAWALSLIAVGLALFATWKAQTMWSKLFALWSVAFTGMCNVLLVIGWSINYVADPLPGLIGLTALIGVGSWFCRQRLVAIGTLAILVFSVGVGFLPGREEATVEKGGVRASLKSHGREGSSKGERFHLTLTSMDGVPIRKKAFVEYIDTSATVGLLPMHNREVFSLPEWMTEIKPDAKLLSESVHTFTPGWAQSVNITINLQKWPLTPLLSVRVPLDVLPTEPIKAKNGDAWLTLDKAEWSLSTNSTPAVPCLALTMRFSDTGRGGYFVGDYRARDDEGNVLDLSSVNGSGSGREDGTGFQILGIKKGTKWIDFAIFSPEQLDANKVVLTFERMATD